ncbi:pitrilysin family protein [Thalassotalea fonticola]|uniref:Pitrilysin family protein n=1 Tax=Thalassotalea fonticola TaxID=3065649 RepID=A0ABZ0GQH8_9GAMM|nr:pitrilysin family protein [Colwelliaceae bacterium S1-1]
MKFLKPTLLGLSVTIALGLSACATNNNSAANQSSQATQTQSSPLTYVRTVEGIEEYTLENGLKVLLYPDPSQPKTLVNVTYRVGSVHEYYGETGMAHLLEHMLFKGSTNYKSIDKEFKKRGMGKNASTWLDRTNYFETFDANEDSLEWAIGMEADRMVNATFTEEDLKSEMTVVRNEMERGENSPFRMLMGRMASTAFLWHNYGNSTIGARSDVENFPFQRLRKFYKKHYRPDNAVLTIAGRFDKDKTMALVEQKFGTLAKPETPIEPLYTVEPTQDGERSVNIRRVGDLPIVGLSYHTPSGLHPEHAALSILADVLGDGTRGRLQKALVEKGIATSASNFIFELKDSSQFLFFVEGDKESDLAKIETELLAIVENLKSQPITQEEIDLTKAKLARQSEQAMRNVTGVGMALSEYIAKGDYRHAFYLRDLVAEVSLEQVQAAAEKYLIQSNRTTGRFIPTEKPVRAEIPAAPDLTEVLKDYKGKEVAAAGEVYDNTVANIKKRLVKSEWPEGTKVNVYPKELRGEQVIISMHFPSGTAETLANKGIAIGFVGSMVKQGNANYSKEQIASKLDQLKSSISISTSLGATNVSISTDKANLDATVKLLGELMAAPTFPEKELEVLKRGAIAGIEQQRNDPGAVAGNSFRKALSNYPKGHPKAFMSLDDKIAAINELTVDEIASLYNSHTNINNGHISIVGDVDAEQVSNKLHAQLSSFVNDTPYEHIKISMKQAGGLVVSTETPDKANSQLYVINPITMNNRHEDYLALKIANTIFGGDSFSSRIGARIRVKEGYSYTVASGLQVNTLDQQGMYYALAISAPENMPGVIAAYKEEVAKVVADGFTETELDEAVKGFVSSRNRSWASDATIASILLGTSKKNEDLAIYDQQIADVQKLTVADINTAFNKYIGALDINIFKAGDFAKVAETK